MRTRTKITIDRWVGLPLMWGLNLLARALGKVLRRDHSVQPERVRTIAVTKYFGMGSILQATPLLRALRRQFPAARLVFVTARANCELLDQLPVIDERLYVDDRGPLALARSTIAVLATLQRRRVDLCFDLEVYAAYASLVALLSLARNRIGFYRYSTRFKLGTYTQLIFFNARQPIHRLYLQLGSAVGVPPTDDLALGPLQIPAQAAADLWRKLPAGFVADPQQPYVVLNPNASDLLLERRWPAERFAALTAELVDTGVRCVLIGARDEAAHTAHVMSLLPAGARQGAVDTAGQLSLAELLALLAGAACVVTNDTGPMHMALALARPTVGLFGPCNPDHYGANQSGLAVLYHPVFCSPCVHEVESPPCAGNNVCMQLIEVEEALRAVRQALQRGRPRGRDREGRGAPDAPEASAVAPLVRASDDAGHPLGMVVRGSVPAR